jgi:hypothetical protein
MEPDEIYFAGARYPTIDDFCAGTTVKIQPFESSLQDCEKASSGRAIDSPAQEELARLSSYPKPFISAILFNLQGNTMK